MVVGCQSERCDGDVEGVRQGIAYPRRVTVSGLDLLAREAHIVLP